MKIAAYKQHNKRLPKNAGFCKTGRLKKDYGAEPMLRLLSKNQGYTETHNARYDAMDELEIMVRIGKPVTEYQEAVI